MALDALSAIENFASSIFSSGINFLFTWGETIGLLSAIGIFTRARSTTALPLPLGKFFGGLFCCAALVSLPSIINATGRQFGLSATSFDAIAYLQPSTFGEAAGAANAVLSIARLAGVGFVLAGIQQLRSSSLEGHTALSASESVRTGLVKVIAGVFLVFSPQVIDRILTSIGLAF